MKFNRRAELLNFEGGRTYRPSPELELFLRAASNLVREPRFYTGAEEGFQGLLDAFEKAIRANPEFVAKLIVYAREELLLRSLPTLGTVILANHERYKGTGIPRKVGERVFTRPDMLTEALAIQFALFGKPIPNSLKKAIRNSFTRFDSYQLAKYRCDRCQVKLKDALLLTHPKPKNKEQEETFKALIEGRLKNTRTWEAKVSTRGPTKETWDEVLEEFIRYKQVFALLRNLRNLIEHEVDREKFRRAMEILADPKEMRRAKVYPYRYLSAYFALKGMKIDSPTQAELRDIALKALREAIEQSTATLPELNGSNLVLVDVSGSMDFPLSRRSRVTLKMVAAFYGAILAKKYDTAIVAFADEYRWIPKGESIFETAEDVLRSRVGYATYAYKPMGEVLRKGEYFDRIFVLTDMVVYSENYGDDAFQRAVRQYRKDVNPEMRLITWDLAGYGQVYLEEHDVRNIYIGGFTERVFDLVKYLEEGNKIVEIINERVSL
ncbi:TROVE domain-containing protein [Thermococcus nautili]|uniref:TROVE domain-containing protein n=1 Tax=Thermococcus nautili TaxID=195522 RepID=W8NWY1_9EURY|nr:TROVE domain-containing protein [Thermococcus nautili]AHL23808.1 TROVE domain-containing protein [Thermococcus nautili]